MNCSMLSVASIRCCNFLIALFFLLPIASLHAQSLDVSSCPVIAKRSNGNGQASSSPGNFPGYGQNNPVAANVTGTSYQTVSYNPTDKTGNVNFKWSSATTITNLPVITRVWLTANGATSATLSAIKFGPPPPPSIVGQDYYASYSFYGQNMPAAGKVTLEFADPQTSKPAFTCTYDLHSNGTATPPTIDCSPTITTQPANQSLCGASSATFTVAGNGINTVQWQVNNSGTWTNISNGGDYSGATTTTLTISNPTSYNGKSYQAVLTGSSGCGSTTSSSALLVAQPKPTAVFSTGTSLCGTGTRSLGVSLTGTAPWTLTYSSTPSGGSTTTATLSNITSSPFYFSVSPSGNTTYALTAVSDAYCNNASPSGAVSTTISSAPTISPSNATTCYGNNSFSLTYTATGSPDKYTLTAGTRAMPGFSTITNATLSGSPASITIPTSGVAAGTYDFNIMVTNSTTSCSSTSTAFTVTVAALPSVSATAGSGSVCTGSSATLTAAPSGLSSYSWTISPSATVIATGVSPSVTVNANTTYTVTGTDANGCSASANVSVTTVAGPTLSISPSAPTICSGNATTLTASGGNTYSWSPSGTLSASTGASVVASPTTTTTYTITSQNITGCQSVGTVTVTVNTPSIGVTSSATICSGGSKALTATGGSSYSWYPTTGLSASTGTSVTATPSATTTYYVVGTDVNGCSATASSTVTISAAPVDAANSVGSTYSFCSSSTSSFSLPVVLTSSVTSATWAYATTSGGTYTNLATGATTIGSGGSAATFTVSSSGLTNTLAVGSYSNGGYGGPRYLRLVIVGSSCTYNYDITLYDIKGSGTAPTPTATKTTVCSGESTVLSIGGLSSSVSIQWQSASTSGGTYSNISGATSSTYTTGNLLTSGTNNYFKAVLSTSGGGGCSYTTGVLQITVASAAASNTVSPSTSCTNGSSTISLTGSLINSASYQWESSTTSSSSGFSDILGAVSQNYSLPNTTVSSTTWFRRTATAGSCSATTSTAAAVYAPLANNQISNSVTSYCTTASATTLNGATPVGGDGTYTYQWQSSTDGTNFTNISSNGTSQNYTTSSQTQSYWYQRVVTSGGCTSTSGSFKITVNTPPTVSVTAGSTQCAATAVTLTGSGAVSYSWSPSTELSATTGSSVTATATSTRTYTVTGTDGNGCTNTATSTITVTAAPSTPTLSSSTKTICSGGTANLNSLVTSGGTYEWYTAPQVSSSYLVSSPTTVSTAGTYYVFAKSNGCYSTNYATLTLSVSNVSAPSVAATSVSYCSPATADLTALQPAAASGTSLEWHTVSSSPSSGNLVASPSAVSGGTYYLYAYSSSGACYGTASSAVTVTINSVTNASVSSTSASACSPSTLDLTSYNNTSGTGNTYSWYSSNSPVAANLVTVPSQVSQSGTYYLYVTNTAGCQGAASPGVALTVNSKPTASISSPASVCSGASSSITATTNASSPSYVWELSTNSGSNWSTVTSTGVYSGATSGTMSISNTTGLGGNYYRYTVTSSTTCTATSDAAILVEDASPSVSTQPADVSVSSGTTTSFTVSISGSPTANYQWQVSTDGGTNFSNVSDNSTYSGSNDAVLIISSPTTGLNNYKYKVTVSNSCTSVTSNSATLTVSACTPPTPSFTASPSSPVCVNTDVTYTTQSGQSSYVWSVPGTLNTDYSISSGGTGSSSNTVTLKWLTSGSKTVTVNYTSSGCAGTTPASSAITVNAASVGGTISGAGAVCTGTNSKTLTLSGNTGSVTKWQSTPVADFSSGVTDIANTTTSLTATNLTAATYYRAVVQNGVCAVANTAIVGITVDASSIGGTIGGAGAVCTGTNSKTLTLSGNTGSVTKWQSAATSNFSGTVTDYNNTTTSLTASNLTADTYYRAVVQSGTCTATNSTVTGITVDALSVGGTISGSGAVCTGTNNTTLTLSGNTGTVTKWQSATTSNFSGTVADITNTTTSLTAANLTTTTYYRAVVQNGTCTADNSSNGTVTVNALPSVSVSPTATAITTGSGTTLTASGANTYNWSPATGLSATTGASVTASPTSNTTYTVTGTNTTTSCTNTATSVITVNGALLAGGIGSDQTICTGTTPATLTSTSAASGGTGTISYQWQQSTDNATFTNISGATSATYSPSSLTQTTYYKRSAQTTNDAAVYSGTVTVTVQSSVGGSIGGSATVCAGTNSKTLTLSGYTGSIVKWQSATTSDFSGTVTDITNAANTLTASNLNTTTYYRAVVQNSSCASDNSNTATITVNALPIVSVSPTAVAITTGSGTTLTASGANTYNWSPSAGLSATSGTAVTASPTTTTTYTVTGTNTTTSCTNTATVTVTVNSTLSAGSISASQSICSGSTPASLSSTAVASGGTGSISYQWQQSTNNSSFTDIGGATSATYAPASLTQTMYYRRGASTTNDVAVYTSAIAITVNAKPTIAVTPSAVTITTGNSTSLTASGANSYSWTPSTALSAANTATVTANPTSTITYTVTGTDNNSCSNTATVTVTVNANPAVLSAGIIGSDQLICSGSTPAAFSSTTDASGGTGSISYQWQQSTDNTSFTDISGAVSATYSPASLTQTLYYRRGAKTNTDAIVYTGSVTVTVQSSAGGTVSGNATVCAGANSQTLTLGGSTGSVIKWQSALAADFSGTLTDINNTTASLTATNLAATTYYRAVVQKNSCTIANSSMATITVNALPSVVVTPASAAITTGSGTTLAASGANNYTWSPATGLSATSGASVTANPTATTTYTVTGTNTTTSCTNTTTVTLTVNPVLSSGTIAASQTICSGTVPAAFTSSADASGGTGSISYQWQQSTDNITFTNIAGANSATYVPSSLTQTTYYRRGAKTSTDATVYTGVVTVTVQSSNGGSVSGAAAVCAGSNSQTLALSGSTGTVIKWQSALAADFSGTVTDINNTTTSLTAANLVTTTYYRAVVQMNACAAANSSTATITVNTLPTVNISPATATITTGSGTTLTASGANTYSWSPATGLSATTGTTVTASPASTTTYTITASNIVTGCSNAVTVVVTVNPALSAGSIGISQTICSGTVPAALASATVAGGGTGSISYQWQQSSDNVNFTDITGATTVGYVPLSLTQTAYYRRAASTTADAAVYTNVVKITVLSRPVTGAIAGDCSVNRDSTRIYKVAGVSNATSYVWTLPAGWSGNSTDSSILVHTGSANGTISVVPYNGTCAGTGASFQVSVIDYAKVTIGATPITVLGDNNSTSQITIQLIDVNGKPIKCSGGVATLCTSSGTFSAVTDHNDGTYTATLKSSANTAVICGSVNGIKISQTVTTQFTGPQGSISTGGPIFATETPRITFNFTDGIGPFTVIYRAGNRSKTDTLLNVTTNTAVPVARIDSTTTYQLVSIIGTDRARRDNNFTRDTATVVVVAPKIVVTLKSDPPKLVKDSVYSTRLSIKVKNIGNVHLNNVQVKANLYDVFPSPVEFIMDSVVLAGTTILPNTLYDGRQNFDLFSRRTTTQPDEKTMAYTSAAYAQTVLSLAGTNALGADAPDEASGIQPSSYSSSQLSDYTGLQQAIASEKEEQVSAPYFFATLSKLAIGVEGDVYIYLRIKPNGYYQPFVMQVAAVGTGNTATGAALANSVSNDNENENLHPEVTRKGDPLPTVIAVLPNPVIGVALSTGTPVKQNDGSYNITLNYVLKNYGDVNLRSVALYQNLLRSIGSPAVFKLAGTITASDNLFINPAYDGSIDTNLLSSNSMLGINQQATVQFTINVVPNQLSVLYRLQAIATGYSGEVNATVRDLSTDGTSPDPDGNNVPDERLISVIAINQSIPSLVSGTIASPDPLTYCGPASAGIKIKTITATQGGVDPYVYQWQSSADNTTYADIPNATDSIYATGSFSASMYLRRKVISGNQMAYSNVIFVQVNPVPKAVITANGTTILDVNGSVVLSANAAQAYIWSTGATAGSITVSTAGQYWVTITDNNGCSASSNTVFVKPPPPVTVKAIYIVGAFTNPANIGVQVQTSATGAVLNYYASATGGTATSVPVLPGSIGDYVYYVSQTVNGQEGIRVPVWVTMIHPATVADVQKSLSRPATLQPDGSFLMGFTINAVNLRPELLDSVRIKDDLTKVFPSPVKFDVLSVTASGKLIVNNLYNGNTQTDLLADGSQLAGYQRDSVKMMLKVIPYGFTGNLNNIAEQTTKSPYGSFRLVSTDPTDANSSGTVRVPTKFNIPVVDIVIPGGFSPNRDGKNDTYVIIRPFNTTISLEVFNRWGNVVYRSANYNNEWDGRGNQSAVMGNELPDGTYYYIILATDKATGAVRKFNGPLTLKK